MIVGAESLLIFQLESVGHQVGFSDIVYDTPSIVSPLNATVEAIVTCRVLTIEAIIA